MSDDLSKERALWCSVVYRAVIDATVKPKKLKDPSERRLQLTAESMVRVERQLVGGPRLSRPDLDREIASLLANELQRVRSRAIQDRIDESIRERAEAREWLLGGSKDFAHVAWLAGMDPEALRDRMRRLSTRSWILDDHTKKRIMTHMELS